MALPDKVELVKHMRASFLQKVQELTVRRNEDDGSQAQALAPVRATDVDDLLYAQIEIDQLVEDLRAVQNNGPLSVADLTQGVEHMFSKYDTDCRCSPPSPPPVPSALLFFSPCVVYLL